ncbi:hypothetical protein ACHWQZ_G007920 [Mnemiopsis leidyi]
MSAGPEERVRALKQLIEHHLNSTGVTDRIDRALRERDKDKVIQDITREDVVDRVITELKNSSLNESLLPEQPEAIPHNLLPPELETRGKRFLQVSLTQGRAFIDDLENNEGANFQLHALCFGKRMRSKPVPATCDPNFDETFYFCLDQIQKQGGLLTCQSRLLLTVVRTSHAGHKQLLGSCEVDWRRCLDRPEGTQLNLEVTGTKSDCGVSVGLLSVRIKILPALQKRISSEVLKSQLTMEHDRKLERERLFLMYTKQWWKEYLALRPAHSDRLVKIFTEDELGITQMVCMMVTPLQSPLIESARHAARFVSQIPCTSTQGCVGNSTSEQWTSLHGFLVANCGDVETHCLLLCSLLLGFSLNSYVCVGSRVKGNTHVWVMTLSETGLPTFWDAVTGQRYVNGDTTPYKTIDCVFNDKSFYANAQPSNSISKTKFDLQDPVLWKGVSEDAIQSMRASKDSLNMKIVLDTNLIDPHHTAANLEHQLKKLIRDEREQHDLGTHWNENLSHLLLPAISAYEIERAAGVTVGNEEFEQAVRHAVPTGFTFKGYPAQFNHLNIRQIFRECMRSEVCSDLITSHGDELELAVKIRIYPYPENVVACWVMFACQYRCIL